MKHPNKLMSKKGYELKALLYFCKTKNSFKVGSINYVEVIFEF